MGYTHYHPQRRSATAEEWALIVRDFGALLARVPEYAYATRGIHRGRPLEIVGPMGAKGSAPVITADRIAFNGGGEPYDAEGESELSHETMELERARKHDEWDDKSRDPFRFCKTARKPYDLVVCALLIVANHHAGERLEWDDGALEPRVVPGAWSVRSDGDARDWQPALEFVASVLGPDVAHLPRHVVEREGAAG